MSDTIAENEHAQTILQLLRQDSADKHELAEAIGLTASTVRDKISDLRDAGYHVEYSHKQKEYYLGEEPTRSADNIGLDEVAEELTGNGKLVSELADEFLTDESTVYDILDKLEESGYQIAETDTPSGTRYHIPDDRDRRFALDIDGSHYRFGLISDTHLGSEASHERELQEFYDRLADAGVTDVFHAGDISDGWKVHQGQLNVIRDEAAGWGNLKNYVIENYPQRDGITTHFIEGNHDHKFYRRNNIHLGRLIADQRDDLHYCGDSQATFYLDDGKNVDLELIHPSGGKPYTTGYRLQTLYRERGLDNRPSIAGVGHLHGSMYAEVEGVKGFYTGAWKGTTTYGKRKGHEAKIGGWIVDVTIQNGSISQLVPQWHGFEEREMVNSYDVEDI